MPKRLDSAKSICSSGVLCNRTNHPCAPLALPLLSTFVKAKLPGVFAPHTFHSCKASVLISLSRIHGFSSGRYLSRSTN